MTQVHVLKSNKSKIDVDKLNASTRKMTRALIGKDGKVLDGPRKWYIQKIGVGHYRVVHNLKKLNYAVSAGQVDDKPLSIETFNLFNVSFDVCTRKDGELIDSDFIVALNVEID